MTPRRTVIIGAEPSGLAAAYELARNGQTSLILEPTDRTGGRFQTEACQGYRFDMGGQTFSGRTDSGSAEVRAGWREIGGDDWVTVSSQSRFCYRYRFLDYPFSMANASKNIGPADTLRAALSYLSAQLQPSLLAEAESLADWAAERWGSYFYRALLEPYVKKVWGISGHQLQAQALSEILLGDRPTSVYPTAGLSAVWENCRSLIERVGSTVELNTRLLRIEHAGNRIKRIVVQQGESPAAVTGDRFICSLAIADLIERLHPSAPPAVVEAAKHLKYRDSIIVPIVVKVNSLFPDSWLYIQSPEFQVGRIQNYANWGGTANSDICLGMEYFCDEGDRLWQMDDAGLIDLAIRELSNLQLVTDRALIAVGTVIRQRQAYPIGDRYVNPLAVVQDYLAGFENLQMVGRKGLHDDYDLDQAMLTGQTAAETVLNKQPAPTLNRRGHAAVSLDSPGRE